jgi:hypothetical protein
VFVALDIPETECEVPIIVVHISMFTHTRLILFRYLLQVVLKFCHTFPRGGLWSLYVTLVIAAGTKFEDREHRLTL